ncbi:TetR/AcrR family transcriptional regulator [Azospirillum sp.]|uniref:TetR/AcrR family transcriptional regulator n=1 Tax=Azospirillum sp. TaxID=34012 RepID=UPI002D59AA7F|nr:TetR/AcrR family transcriptional regulator [Azospirillum sp.]HYD64361.1 TetR/AcrR family transcriptional regulator [Azospirillum sp.]
MAADPSSDPSDTPLPRWRRRKEARPQEIVDAALDVFAERGFAAARLEDVAARAGVSKGTLYLYFPNKEELFKAVVRSAILPNLEMAERLLAEFPGSSMEILERLLLGIAGKVMATRVGAIPKLMIAEAGNFPELARFYYETVIARAFRVIGAVLERGVARGEFRAMDVGHTVRLVVAPMLMVALWRTSFEPVAGGPLDAEGLMRTHIDHLRRALAPEGGAS